MSATARWVAAVAVCALSSAPIAFADTDTHTVPRTHGHQGGWQPAFMKAYNWSRFPAAWFGANDTQWESEAQLAEIGRYSMAILGWQHLANLTDWSAVVYTQLTQAAIIKARHPDLPVFVFVDPSCRRGHHHFL